MDQAFNDFFRQLTGYEKVYGWQSRLGEEKECRNQLIRVPTGFGKTAGAVIAWLWNRVYQGKVDWPRRLVFCLPMRTLVEQTERAVQEWLSRGKFIPQPKIHVLLGGMSLSDWHLEPECNAILIGTQDMLLSRALNRGYGSGRARWPMEYGLLNVDCLWVMDEIQLMDVGLATSGQLQAFAVADEIEGKLPCLRRTWWMSATLQRDWLRRVYRPRFLGQFFELSSCSRLEGKQGLVSLPRGLEVEPFDQPLFVVALPEFFERFGQLLQSSEVPHPQELLLQSAEEAFDATVALWLAHEGR